MERPELTSVDASADAPLSGLTRNELRIFPNQTGYHIFLGFGQDTAEFQVSTEGAFERRERSGPSLAYRRFELAELPPAARQAVAALVADYRATRAGQDGPSL